MIWTIDSSLHQLCQARAPIVGATKPLHLSDAVASLEITLSDEEVARLEEPYVPRLPEF